MHSPPVRRRHRVTVIAWIAIALALVQGTLAAEKQTASGIEPLYRTYTFGTNPKFNPQARFELEEYVVPRLWENLQVQIFKAWAVAADSRLERSPVLYADGKIIPFVNAYGGGLLSAVVGGDALYYSYGFGSGIHRSKVGRLRMKGGQAEQHESAAFGMADMLVENAGNRVRVVVRDFPRPNDQPAPLGWIDLQESTRLKLIDDAGREVMLPMQRPPPTREEAMRRRAKMDAPFVKTQDTATRELLNALGVIIDANNRAFISPAMDDPTKIDQRKAQAAADAWNLLTEENRKPAR